jgi:hypothetical protein
VRDYRGRCRPTLLHAARGRMSVPSHRHLLGAAPCLDACGNTHTHTHTHTQVHKWDTEPPRHRDSAQSHRHVSEVSLRQACISVFCLTVFIEYLRKFSSLKVPAMLPHLSQFLNICYRLIIFVLLEMSIDILWLKCVSHLIFWSICTTSWPSSET